MTSSRTPTTRNRARSTAGTGRDHRRLTYEQLSTSPFLQTKESETELVELIVNTGAGHQDGKKKAWACKVLLSCHDKREPEERRRAEKIQLKFASLLQT